MGEEVASDAQLWVESHARSQLGKPSFRAYEARGTSLFCDNEYDTTLRVRPTSIFVSGLVFHTNMRRRWMHLVPCCAAVR